MGKTNNTNTIKTKGDKLGKTTPTSVVKNGVVGPKKAETKKKPQRRGDKKRPVTKELFLAKLLDKDVVGNVLVACRRLHIDRSTVYDWKKQDEEFAKKWEAVQEEADDLLADEAENALLTGIRSINPTLIIFTLKNRRPKRWKDRFEHGGPDGGPIEHAYEVSPEFAEAMDKYFNRSKHGKNNKDKPTRG